MTALSRDLPPGPRINNAGMIVYNGTIYDGRTAVPLRSLLEDPLWEVTIHDLNDHGAMVGRGSRPGDTIPRAVLLEPIFE